MDLQVVVKNIPVKNSKKIAIKPTFALGQIENYLMSSSIVVSILKNDEAFDTHFERKINY